MIEGRADGIEHLLHCTDWQAGSLDANLQMDPAPAFGIMVHIKVAQVLQQQLEQLVRDDGLDRQPNHPRTLSRFHPQENRPGGADFRVLQFPCGNK